MPRAQDWIPSQGSWQELPDVCSVLQKRREVQLTFLPAAAPERALQVSRNPPAASWPLLASPWEAGLVFFSSILISSLTDTKKTGGSSRDQTLSWNISPPHLSLGGSPLLLSLVFPGHVWGTTYLHVDLDGLSLPTLGMGHPFCVVDPCVRDHLCIPRFLFQWDINTADAHCSAKRRDPAFQQPCSPLPWQLGASMWACSLAGSVLGDASGILAGLQVLLTHWGS